MRVVSLLLMLFPLAFQAGDPAKSVVVNAKTAKWTHDAGDPPGSESVVLREDSKTGAFEIFARYPAGHTFNPHWHSVNERLLVIEGKMTVGKGESAQTLDPGGYAYLPAKEVQYLSCGKESRCAFYAYWDGKLDFHRASEPRP